MLSHATLIYDDYCSSTYILHTYHNTNCILYRKKMNFDKTFLRHSLLYEYFLGHNASEAHRNLCIVFGTDTPSQRTCEVWFARFRSGNYSIEDETRSGRPVSIDNEQLFYLVMSEPRMNTRELGTTLGVTHTAIEKHLEELDFVKKLGAWLPHKLTTANMMHRVSICSSLISRKRRTDWIREIITGDEKWVLYVNHTRKRQWLPRTVDPEPDPKPEKHEKKVMMSVFWDSNGIIWWELLHTNEHINASIYCSQLEKLTRAVQEKRPNLRKKMILHDNARPHIAKETKRTLNELDWEVLPHPAYSPDLAPSDYHLFRKMANVFKEKSFDDYDHLKSEISDFFTSLQPEFLTKGIDELPKRWNFVVDNDGKYFID